MSNNLETTQGILATDSDGSDFDVLERIKELESGVGLQDFINQAVSAESQRAQDAEAGLQSQIDQKADQSDLDAEIARAQGVEAGLQSQITTTTQDLTAHTGNTNNPHAVTATQVGAATNADITSSINAHNTSNTAHQDIRDLYINMEYVRSVTFDPATDTLTFTKRDNTTLSVNTGANVAIDFDETTNELIIHNSDGTDSRVDISALIPVITGATTSTIQTTIVSNQIQANIVAGSITANELSTALNNLIASKMALVTTATANNIATFDVTGQVQDGGTSITALQTATASVASDLATHETNKTNPHDVTIAQIGAASATDLANHIADTDNPHSVTKAQVGLGNVDNTADVDKPVSTAQQQAIDDAIQTAIDGLDLNATIVQTDAEWAADTTTILKVGEFGASVNADGSITYKAGNGVDIWNSLPIMHIVYPLPRLATPTGLVVNNYSALIQWNAVVNATGYVLEIHGNTVFTIPVSGGTTTEYTFTDAANEMTYLIAIKAVGDGVTFRDSELSDFVTLHKVDAPITVSFASDSWETIEWYAQNGTAQNVYSVGDEKTVNLIGGNQLTFQIMDFNKDVKSDGTGTAGITIAMKNLHYDLYQMNPSGFITPGTTDSNVGGWDACHMRLQTMPTLLALMPTDLQAVIKTVTKLTANQGATAGRQIIPSEDKLWLFSEAEIYNSPPYSAPGEGTQYAYWADAGRGANATSSNTARVKAMNNGTGGNQWWWLRSPFSGNTAPFCVVAAGGAASYGGASASGGVCLGFCV